MPGLSTKFAGQRADSLADGGELNGAAYTQTHDGLCVATALVTALAKEPFSIF